MLPVPRMLLDIEFVLGSMAVLAVLDVRSWLLLLFVRRGLLLDKLLDNMDVVLPIMEALLPIMGVLFVMMELLFGIMEAGGRWVDTRWWMWSLTSCEMGKPSGRVDC